MKLQIHALIIKPLIREEIFMINKTFKHILTLTTVALGLVAALGNSAVLAQDSYPEKPIRFIVGFSAGGGTDSIARSIASFIHEEIGMPAVVINKPGASSMIALKFLMSQEPDGYTLMVQSGASGLGQYLRGKSPANPYTDLKIIGQIGTIKTSLCVPMDSPFETAQDVVDAAKKRPGELRWGHGGRGSTNNIAGESFLRANGLDVKDVPTKGGSRARGLLVSNQVDFGFIGPHLLTGFESKVRCLALSTSNRDGVMTDIPTLKELGLNYKDITTPMMLLARKEIPEDRYQKLVVALKNLSEIKGFQKFIKKSGIAVEYRSPEDAFAYYSQLCQNMKPVVDDIFEIEDPKSCP